MKADDGHFEYRLIAYFVVQITTDFLCHITKYDAFFLLQTFREHQKRLRGHTRNKKFNNFVIIKNNTTAISCIT